MLFMFTNIFGKIIFDLEMCAWKRRAIMKNSRAEQFQILFFLNPLPWIADATQRACVFCFCLQKFPPTVALVCVCSAFPTSSAENFPRNCFVYVYFWVFWNKTLPAGKREYFQWHFAGKGKTIDFSPFLIFSHAYGSSILQFLSKSFRYNWPSFYIHILRARCLLLSNINNISVNLHFFSYIVVKQ